MQCATDWCWIIVDIWRQSSPRCWHLTPVVSTSLFIHHRNDTWISIYILLLFLELLFKLSVAGSLEVFVIAWNKVKSKECHEMPLIFIHFNICLFSDIWTFVSAALTAVSHADLLWLTPTGTDLDFLRSVSVHFVSASQNLQEFYFRKCQICPNWCQICANSVARLFILHQASRHHRLLATGSLEKWICFHLVIYLTNN